MNIHFQKPVLFYTWLPVAGNSLRRPNLTSVTSNLGKPEKLDSP